MLKVKIDSDTKILSFICPFCGNNDVTYITMPSVCWNCGKKYLFDVTTLVNFQYNRYTYYKYERG